MFKVVPFKPEHVEALIDLPENKCLLDWMKNGNLAQMEKTGFTGLWNEQAMVCGGVAEYWENRGHIWTFFSKESRHNFVPVFRGMKAFLNNLHYRRLEIEVPVGFELGHRRAQLFGFKLECPFADKYLPSGEACALYSYVRK